MPDPATVVGSDAHRRRAFDDTLKYLSRRIDLMLALPFQSLERRALEIRLAAIGDEAAVETLSFPEA
jgi:arsenate reductase